MQHYTMEARGAQTHASRAATVSSPCHMMYAVSRDGADALLEALA